MEQENIYEKIQEIIGNLPGNFSILEEQIDIETQMEYFEFSKSDKKEINAEEILKRKNELFSEDISLEDKKTLLVQLASIDNVEAYRFIEKFVKKADIDNAFASRPSPTFPTDGAGQVGTGQAVQDRSSIKNDIHKWAVLALQESRMLLESSLLDENQVFISTGLGGKGSKLRYFIVLLSNTNNEFSEVHRKIIKSEFEFILKNYDAEVEKINFKHNFSTILCLIPLNISIQNVFEEIIKECNQYGNFLKSNFIVTNVKILSVKEISEFLEKNKE